MVSKMNFSIDYRSFFTIILFVQCFCSTLAIVGCPDSISHPYPFYVSIMTKNATAETFHCGGVLVTSQHVLTSASCATPRFLKVRLEDVDGVYNVTNVTYQNQEHRMAPSPRGLVILTLSNQIEFDIAPAVLAENDLDVDYCRMDGMGFHEEDFVLCILKVPLVENYRCQEEFGVTADRLIDEMCTEGSEESHFSETDVGGPLIHNKILVGIITGTNIENDEENDFANLHVRVANYKDFILEATKPLPVNFAEVNCVEIDDELTDDDD